MRPCPYCANEIQDEAIVCRYCGLDVERPDWLRGKVRCQFCAEWISPNQALCPYCKSELSEGAPEAQAEPATAAPSTPALEPEPVPPPEAAQGDPPQSISPRRRTSPPPMRREQPEGSTGPFKSTEQPARRDPFESSPIQTRAEAPGGQQESSQPFDSPYLDQSFGDAAGDEPMAAQPVEAEPRFKLDLSQALGDGGLLRAGRWALFGLLGLAVISGVIWLAVRFGGEIPVSALSPATATPTPIPTRRPTAAVLATSAPTAAATSNAAVAGCVAWTEITDDNVGETRCVYGTVKRWFAAGDLAFVAIFSEEAGTFALVDRTLAHPEVSPGECIRGDGEIEFMSGTRPFIDLNGVVLSCD